MHDVPKDLMKQIKDLEQQFTIDTPKLLEIVGRFRSELEKGKLPPQVRVGRPSVITRVLV